MKKIMIALFISGIHALAWASFGKDVRPERVSGEATEIVQQSIGDDCVAGFDKHRVTVRNCYINSSESRVVCPLCKNLGTFKMKAHRDDGGSDGAVNGYCKRGGEG